jgi:hypothetical protein
MNLGVVVETIVVGKKAGKFERCVRCGGLCLFVGARDASSDLGGSFDLERANPD